MAGSMKSKEIHKSIDSLVHQAARAWTVENLGGNPEREDMFDLIESETEDVVLEEHRAWLRVAKAASKELVKRKVPWTIEELDKVSKEPQFDKLYR